MSKMKTVGKWIPTILLALPMIGAGSAKLMGVPALHESFHAMGLPEWFGYFIGAAELAGGIGLLLPKLSAWAATGLVPIMLGAVYFHFAYAVPSAIPALVFIALSVYTIIVRKSQTIGYPF